MNILDFPGGSGSKESACNAGDPGSISGSGRSPGDGHGYPLQYSCLESMNRGARWAAVQGMAKSRIHGVKHFHFHEHPGPQSFIQDIWGQMGFKMQNF